MVYKVYPVCLIEKLNFQYLEDPVPETFKTLDDAYKWIECYEFDSIYYPWCHGHDSWAIIASYK